MSTLGSLHILAPEVPDGLSCWRLQVRVDDGQTPAGGAPTHETLLLSDGELKRIRERAAKRPAAILPAPEPTVPVADLAVLQARYEAVEGERNRANLDLLKTRADLATANAGVESVTVERDLTKAALVTSQGDLAATRADLETTHSDLAAIRANLSVTKADLDADRDNLRAAMEAADKLQADLVQSEALRVAQTPAVLSPWADLGRAIRRALGI